MALLDEPVTVEGASGAENLALMLRRHFDGLDFGNADSWAPAERRFFHRLSAALAAFETGSSILAPAPDEAGRAAY